MDKNTAFIMIGPPGSGKTTIAKEMLESFDSIDYISRDEIRFGLMEEGDEYFANEYQVYRRFIYEILKSLNEGRNVIIDATHLNRGSRQKLFNAIHIDKNKTKVIGLWMRTPLEVCIERNETRKGTRAYVPEPNLRKMFFRMEAPSYTECNHIFDTIYLIHENGIITQLQENK